MPTAAATLTPEPTFTPTPDWRQQELGFPNELSGCFRIESLAEVLEFERRGFSFAEDLPGIEQELEIEKWDTKDLYALELGTHMLRPEDSPIKPVTCSRMTVDGAEVYVAGIAVKNRDGSTGFLHLIIGGTDAGGINIPVYVASVDETGGWRPRPTEVGEAFEAIKYGVNVISVGYGTKDRAGVLGLGLKFYVDYFDKHPELFGLIEEYFRTGITPEELQSMPIPLYTVDKPQ